MADAWYILNRGQTLGPATAEQLKQLARQGKLTPETQIAKEKDGPWVPAARLKGLFPEPAAAPPQELTPAGPPVVAAVVDDDSNDNQIGDTKFCHECGKKIRTRAEICPKCGIRQPGGSDDRRVRHGSGNKMGAGLCGIFLGSLGIHKFVLGLTTPGVLMLLFTLLTCGFGGMLMAIIGLIEGIIYLSKSDEDFYTTYVVEKKGWF